MPFDIPTWNAWQIAAASGHIRYLYKFVIEGRISDTIIGYCTGSDEVTFDDVTYVPFPCAHEEIKRTSDDAETQINLAASKLWLSLLFMNNPKKLHVEIIRYRTELLDGATLYRGAMRERTIQTNVIKISFGSSFAASATNMITYYTQRYCNHTQYSQYCGMLFDDFKQAIPAAGYTLDSRKVIRLTPDYQLNLGANYWRELILIYTVTVTDGDYTFSFEQDNIARSVTPDTITLKYPLNANVDVTNDMVIAPNCLLELPRCRDVFGNLHNACGWPDMPLRNYAAMDASQLGKGEGGPASMPDKSPLRA